MKKTPSLYAAVLILIFFLSFIDKLYADTLYLKNGRSIDGLIKNEDEQNIELDVGFGTIKFPRKEIERVSKSTTEESQSIQQEWQKKKLEAKEEKLRKELEPKDIKVQQEKGYIAINAVLNKRIPVLLVLDTGASMVVLSNNTAKKLGLDSGKKEEMLQLKLADGRKINGRYVLLESITVQDVEAKDVDAAVLLEDVEDAGFKDGLLGMSFLNRFNFKVDQKNKRLILEKIE